jgi:hypothetical protein
MGIATVYECLVIELGNEYSITDRRKAMSIISDYFISSDIAEMKTTIPRGDSIYEFRDAWEYLQDCLDNYVFTGIGNKAV